MSTNTADAWCEVCKVYTPVKGHSAFLCAVCGNARMPVRVSPHEFTMADMQKASAQGVALGAERMRRACVQWLMACDLNPCGFKNVGDQAGLRTLARDAAIRLGRDMQKELDAVIKETP